MKTLNSSSKLLFAATIGALILSGCATRSSLGPAPVVDRSTTLSGSADIERPADRLMPGSVEDSGRLHTVAPGDTLYNISVRYGFAPAQLAALNGIGDPTQLRLGQVLRLPVSVAAPRDYVPNPNVRITQITGGVPVEQPVEVMTPGVTGAQPVSLDDGSAVVNTEGTVDTAATVTDPNAVPAAGEAVEAPAETAPVPATQQPAPQVLPGARMIWPLQGKILANFGGASKGIDIAGVKGDVVVASMPGEVFYVGNGIAEYGFLVIIKHSPTLVSAYAHNSKIVVKQGQRVKSGEKIAEVGQSGTDRPKLHFEVREMGTPVDPMNYLPRR